MENQQEQKIGAGIKTISIISLVFEGLLLLSSIFGLVVKDSVNSALKKAGTNTTVSASTYIIAIIISVILILLKNTIGVIAYFAIYICSTIYSIVQAGFKPSVLVEFIVPILMAIFIYQKRSIFKLKREEGQIS